MILDLTITLSNRASQRRYTLKLVTPYMVPSLNLQGHATWRGVWTWQSAGAVRSGVF
jgi:hypothetical protein